MCVWGGGGESGCTLNFACYVDWDFFFCGGWGGVRILNLIIFRGSGKGWLFFFCRVLGICRYFLGVSFKTAFFLCVCVWGEGGGRGCGLSNFSVFL